MTDEDRIELIAVRLFERDFREVGIPRPFAEISHPAKLRYRAHAIDFLNFMFKNLDIIRKEKP